MFGLFKSKKERELEKESLKELVRWQRTNYELMEDFNKDNARMKKFIDNFNKEYFGEDSFKKTQLKSQETINMEPKQREKVIQGHMKSLYELDIQHLKIQKLANSMIREQEDKKQAQIDELLNPFKEKVDKYLEMGFKIEKLELTDTWTELDIIKFNERFTIKDISVEFKYPEFKVSIGSVTNFNVRASIPKLQDDVYVIYHIIKGMFYYLESKFEAQQSKIKELENEAIRESLLKELTK